MLTIFTTSHSILTMCPVPGADGVRLFGQGDLLDEEAVNELMRQVEHKANVTHGDHIKVNLEKLRHKHNPTLEVAHDHFKPALEGSELSYQDNPAQQDDNEF